MRSLLLALLVLASATAQGQWIEYRSGHLKGQYLLGTYPDDSVYRELIGSPSHDFNADLRLLLGGRGGAWDWQADYQFVARTGDTLELARSAASNPLLPGANLDDGHRLMDLTHVIHESDDSVLLHRLDRLHAGYTGERAVLRFGRQAVSWGNGLIYNPVDFFNPFDPAAVDKEYKTGDDMLYGQYLLDSGNDWQGVAVFRRDLDGNTSGDVNSYAIKYHAFVGEREVDVLLSEHFRDEIFSLGGLSNWGGAIVRGDLMLTHTDEDTYTSLVANLSYSWEMGGKNTSGVLEYFYSGLGLREEDYDALLQEEDLLERLLRGELFTIGRHYLAGGLTIEMHPLFNLSPNIFLNLEDGSSLVQVLANYDLHQNWQLIAALNAPFGDDGTEFGGLETGQEGLLLSAGPSLFVQLAWYF
jgi:hypothetical protein